MATKQKDSAGDQATIPPLERKALTKISALVTRSTPLARHFYHGSTGSLISSGCAYLVPAETSPAHSSRDELLRDRPLLEILEHGTHKINKFLKKEQWSSNSIATKVLQIDFLLFQKEKST